MNIFQKIESYALFSEIEAWNLFKYAAFSEAFGWSLLLYGIAAKQYHLPGESFMLPIGGSLHGLFFLSYLLIIVLTYTSLGWPRIVGILGIFVSIIPFGTLLLEQWGARRHLSKKYATYKKVRVYGAIVVGKTILAVQYNNSVEWTLPGGVLQNDESISRAAERIIENIFEEKPIISDILCVQEYAVNDSGLAIIFKIANSQNFKNIDTAQLVKRSHTVDEINWLAVDKSLKLQPAWLAAKLIQKNVSSDDKILFSELTE